MVTIVLESQDCKLELIHENGDKHTVTIRAGLFMQDWKHGRKILMCVWGNLAGEYAFDIQRDCLFNFGPGGGLCRKSLRWHAVDIKEAWRIWYKVTEHGRNLNERNK